MMKKLYLFGMMSLLLVGCSTEVEDLINAGNITDTNATEATTDEDQIPEDDGIAVMGDVPITFSVGSAELTRSFIESDNFVCDDAAIFALPRLGFGTTANKYVNWAATTGTSTSQKLNQWMVNVPIAFEEVGGEDGKLVWKDGEEKHNYPKANSSAYYIYAYSFGAYHPRTEDYILSSNQVTLNFGNLDGTVDIITALAEKPTDDPDDKGFSETYFKSGKTEKPHFSFKHRMSRLEIKVRLKDENPDIEEYFIDSIWTSNLPDSMSLRLMTRNTTTNEVTESSTVQCIYGSVRSFHAGDADNKSIREANGGAGYKLTKAAFNAQQIVGDGILIPPLQPNNTYYWGKKVKNGYTAYSTITIYLRLKDAGGNTNYKYRVSVAPPTNGWKEGKRYPINIQVNPEGETDVDAGFARAELVSLGDDDEWTEPTLDGIN